nr:RecName: Full=M protein, serotype 32 [Streptococcus thermophilus]
NHQLTQENERLTQK